MSGSPLLNELRVVEVIIETPAAKTLVLEPVGDWKPHYRSGQFFTFLFETPFGQKRRSYSVSGSPELGDPLTITIKRIANGEFSRPLTEKTKAGDILRTVGSGGFFCLPDEIKPDQQFCFLAAGSGVTPCFSLIRTLLYTTPCKVVLIYSNKNKSETIFYHKLQQMVTEFGSRFRVRFLFSENNNIYEKRFSKWLGDILLNEFFPGGRNNVLFYLCGPFEYMQTARIVLLMHTVPENIRTEEFRSFPRLILPEPPDHEGHEVTVKIAGQVHKLFVKFPRSITKTASEKNILVPFSCEAGRCGSCVATCTKGKLWMAYNEMLTDSEIASGRVLTCQAYPVFGDAEIVFE
jgi:ring-1,2-phenylacetyl-CoA epoxidase subunit PaaE